MYEGLVTLWRSMPTLCAIWGASTQLLHVDVCLWYLLVHQRKQAISILPRDGWTTCTDHRIVFSGTKRRSVAMSEPHPSNSFCRSSREISSTHGVPAGRSFEPMGISYLAENAATLIYMGQRASQQPCEGQGERHVSVRVHHS